MSDLVIRAERAEEFETIAAVVTAAFGSPAEAELIDLIRASPNYVPEWALVAETDGRIVGHTMVSWVGLAPEGDATDMRRIPCLSPLAVVPTYERRGVGSALVHAVAARVDDAGEPFVVLEGASEYYGRLGFEFSVPLGIHIKLPGWAPPESAQLRRLRAYDPSIRGQLVYPPAYDGVLEN
jgi:putative acetyltransferase